MIFWYAHGRVLGEEKISDSQRHISNLVFISKILQLWHSHNPNKNDRGGVNQKGKYC